MAAAFMLARFLVVLTGLSGIHAVWISECGSSQNPTGGLNGPHWEGPTVEDLAEVHILCEGAGPNETVFWQLPDENYQYLAACGPLGTPCTTDYPDLFNVTRGSATSSRLTIFKTDRNNPLTRGYFRCKTYEMSDTCVVGPGSKAEVDSCCASMDVDRKVMNGSCVIRKAWDSRWADNGYGCYWYEQRGIYPEVNVDSETTFHDFTENGLPYKGFTCHFSKAIADFSYAYSYRVEIRPGEIEMKVPASPSCPGAEPSKNTLATRGSLAEPSQNTPATRGSLAEPSQNTPADSGSLGDSEVLPLVNRTTSTSLAEPSQNTPADSGRLVSDMTRWEQGRLLSCCVTQDHISGDVRGGCSFTHLRSESYFYDRLNCSWSVRSRQGETFFASKTWAYADYLEGNVYYHSSLCVFDRHLNIQPGDTFTVSATSVAEAILVDISPTCDLLCGPEAFSCGGLKCLNKWQVCNYYTDCDGGRDESWETCHWWCVFDPRGTTCIIILASVFGLITLVLLKLLFSYAQPNRQRGRCLQWRKRSQNDEDKFELIGLWVHAFLYYLFYCCCQLRLPTFWKKGAATPLGDDFIARQSEGETQEAGNPANKRCADDGSDLSAQLLHYAENV